MEKEIARLQADVGHIKSDTDEIKRSIAVFITNSQKSAVEIEALRGRTRESEHDILALQGEVKTLRAMIWKISVILALISSGISVGIEKIF